MPPPASERQRGSIRLGTFAGSEVFVSASWFVVAALIAVLLAPRVEDIQPGLGAWKYVVGVAFAVVLYAAVLLHEGSHAVVARRFGHPVHAITLSFLGGRTEVGGESSSPRQEFWTAVVGPLTSLAIGGAALAVLLVTPDGLLVLAVEALAISNLLLGVLNLLPAMPLDGGRVLKAAVWAVTGSALRGSVVSGWCGRIAAVALVLTPVVVVLVLDRDADTLSVLLLLLLGAFLWTAASAEMTAARMRHRLGGVVAGDLARPALAVPGDLPLAEALRRSAEAGRSRIVTVDARGAVTGVVDAAALAATPQDRRPWVATAAVARTLDPGATLPAAAGGEGLIDAINARPSPAYAVVAADGILVGVLDIGDVDRAVRGLARR